MIEKVPSPYQQNKDAVRTETTQRKARERRLREHRVDIENVEECENDRADQVEYIDRFDSNDEGFHGLVELQTDTLNRKRAFWAGVGAYVICEFFVAGNVADWLATDIMPMLQDQSVENGGEGAQEVPLWMRQAAGALFVGMMLAATLLIKYLTHIAGVSVRKAREALQPGEDMRAAFLASQAVGIMSLKIMFLGGVAWLYVWLFGFSVERAELLSQISQVGGAEIDPLAGFVIDDSGELTTQDALEEPSKESEVSGKMAYATAVIYAVCWCIHGVLLWFPVSGFTSKLIHANFDRERALQDARRALRERVRINRRILERIDEETDPGTKEALIRAVQPIRHLIMEDAQQENRDDEESLASASASADPQNDTEPDSNNAAEQALGGDEKNTANATQSPTGSSNVFDLLFGAREDDESAA